MFYTLKKKDLPPWVVAVIVGALGYFILPLDGIPDLAPLVGFSDDLGAMLGAMATVASHIDEEVKTKARDKINQWFGENESRVTGEL